MQFDKKKTRRNKRALQLADSPADKHQPDTFVPGCKWWWWWCLRLLPDLNSKVLGSINFGVFSCWVSLMQVSVREDSSPLRLFDFAPLELWEMTPVLSVSDRHAACLLRSSAVTSLQQRLNFNQILCHPLLSRWCVFEPRLRISKCHFWLLFLDVPEILWHEAKQLISCQGQITDQSCSQYHFFFLSTLTN